MTYNVLYLWLTVWATEARASILVKTDGFDLDFTCLWKHSSSDLLHTTGAGLFRGNKTVGTKITLWIVLLPLLFFFFYIGLAQKSRTPTRCGYKF